LLANAFHQRTGGDPVSSGGVADVSRIVTLAQGPADYLWRIRADSSLSAADYMMKFRLDRCRLPREIPAGISLAGVPCGSDEILIDKLSHWMPSSCPINTN